MKHKRDKLNARRLEAWGYKDKACLKQAKDESTQADLVYIAQGFSLWA